MTHFKTEVDDTHTALLDRSKSFTAQAAAPLATVLSQLKLYTAQSMSAEEKRLAKACSDLERISKSVAAPDVTALAALVAASPGWPASVGPELEISNVKYAAARKAFEAALADAATTTTPREVVFEADVPASALATDFALGTAELCGVRFSFSARRGCNCASKPLSSSLGVRVSGAGVEDVNAHCACGLECKVKAEPVWKALAALYKACGARALAVDKLVSTNNDDSDDDEDCHINGAVGTPSIDNSAIKAVNPAATADVLVAAPPLTTVASTFGCVNVSVTAGVKSESSNQGQTRGSGQVWLTGGNHDVGEDANESKSHVESDINAKNAASAVESGNGRTAVITVGLPSALNVALSQHNASNTQTSNNTTVLRVRCSVSFPDVVQQARALQLCVDAVATDIVAQADANQQRVLALEAEKKVWQVSKADYEKKILMLECHQEKCKVDYEKRVRLLESDKEALQNRRNALETEKRSWQKCKMDYNSRIRSLETDKEAPETKLTPHWQRVADDEAYEKTKAEEEAKAKAEEVEARRRDAPWVTLLKSSAWEAEFNTHIAHTLSVAGIWGFRPPKRKLRAPSSAVLGALQKKARDRMLSYSALTLKTAYHSDFLMKAQFRDPQTQEFVDYCVVIRLDDAKFPATAAYVRFAVSKWNFSYLVHHCFVPPGHSTAAMPFFTLCRDDVNVLCKDEYLMVLPDADIVYGEYTAPGADAGLIYPVGSVLVYPHCVVPSPSFYGDTPIFIVV